MKARFDNIDLFYNILKIVDSVLFEPDVLFNPEGMNIEGNGKSKIDYLKCFIDRTFFVEYVPGEDNICINLKDLVQIFNKIPHKNCVVTVEIDSGWFIVKGKSTSSFKYKLPIIAKEKEQITRPKADTLFDAEIIMPNSIFLDLLDFSIKKDNKIVMYCTEFFFNVQDDEPQTGLSVQRVRKSTIVDIKCPKPVRAKYNNRDYLLKISPLFAKLSEKVRIRYSTDFPISLYTEFKGVKCDYMLAPIIENELAQENTKPEDMEDN